MAIASFRHVNTSMIFVNKNLTKSNRLFIGHARRFGNENGLKYAWVKDESSEFKNLMICQLLF